ncbi:hypothetical protein MC885_003943 [Smutsia gigantea]|nr:hypothetical protein MC885_003943 [Smutsia gigantea]
MLSAQELGHHPLPAAAFDHCSGGHRWLTWLITLLSASVHTIPSLSISAISTNCQGKAGGRYFFILHSLVPELGESIGIIFAFANTVAVAMHTAGSAETLSDLLWEHGVQLPNMDPKNEFRYIGPNDLLLPDPPLFYQLPSGDTPPHTPQLTSHWLLWVPSIFLENTVPQRHGPEGSFSGMFSIVFSSATGILPRTTISGDLKDLATAITKGTLLAIMWTTLSYLGISVTNGSCMIRDASGNITDMGVQNGSCMGPERQYGWDFSSCREQRTCHYGLSNYYQAMSIIPAFSPLTSAGILSATLSSALSCFVSAPKIFQTPKLPRLFSLYSSLPLTALEEQGAVILPPPGTLPNDSHAFVQRLCQDKPYLVIGFLGKGYGQKHKRVRGCLSAFLMAAASSLLASAPPPPRLIDRLSPHAPHSLPKASFLSSPESWHPSFRGYSPWLSLLGSLLCLRILFPLTWWAVLIAMLLSLLPLPCAFYKKPGE